MEYDFNWKYKDYELRFTTTENPYIELVKWKNNSIGGRYCFTLVYWVKSDEGYDLKFVSDRPFNHIDDSDVNIVWKAMKVAQGVLDNMYKMHDIVEEMP